MPSSQEHRAKHEDNRNHLDTGNNGGPLSTLNGCWAATVQDVLINQRLVQIETYVNNIFNPPPVAPARLAVDRAILAALETEGWGPSQPRHPKGRVSRFCQESRRNQGVSVDARDSAAKLNATQVFSWQ